MTTNTQSDIVPITSRLPDKRRFFHVMDDHGVRYLLVQPTISKALEALSDLDLETSKLTLKELPAEVAERYRVRPGDDSPADTLAEAPMGSLYSTEV